MKEESEESVQRYRHFGANIIATDINGVNYKQLCVSVNAYGKHERIYLNRHAGNYKISIIWLLQLILTALKHYASHL